MGWRPNCFPRIDREGPLRRVFRVSRPCGPLAAFSLAAFAAPAFASTQPAAGTFVEGPETITSEKFSGGNTTYTLTREVVFSGTYSGVGQADQRIVIHKDGSANVHMTIAFTGLVCGTPASVDILIVGKADFNENTIAGRYTVLGRGESDEKAPRGNGTFSGVPGVGGIYEGEVHCG